MAQTMTVTLPADVKQAVYELSKKDSVLPDEIVGRTDKQHLFLRQFHLLRERMLAKANNQGVITDQDVFDRVL